MPKKTSIIIIKDVTKLEEIMAKKGYTYTGLAGIIGVSKAFVTLMLSGERNPSNSTAHKICKALDIEFNKFFYIKSLQK